MKKTYFFRAAAVLVACALAGSFQSCDDGEDEVIPPKTEIPVIKTGIVSRATVEEIILMDRNIGATEPGGVGFYLTWTQAQTACPEGYTLLSGYDCGELTNDYDLTDTPTFWGTTLKWPFAGYYDGAEKKEPTGAFYWVDDEDYDDAAKAYYHRIRTSDPYVMGPFGTMLKTMKMQVRCQLINWE